MGETPFGHDGAAARYDARDPFGGEGHITEQYAGMHGEVINALFGLFDDGVHKDVKGEVFGNAAYFFQSLINRYCADGYGRVADDPLAGFVDVFTRG